MPSAEEESESIVFKLRRIPYIEAHKKNPCDFTPFFAV